MRIVLYTTSNIIELDVEHNITVNTLVEQLEDMNTLLIKQVNGNHFIINTANVVGIDVVNNNEEQDSKSIIDLTKVQEAVNKIGEVTEQLSNINTPHKKTRG